MTGPKRPAVIDFGPAQSGPKPTGDYGYNIARMLSRTMLEYTQGLFMNPGLPHQFAYDENTLQGKKIYIVNPQSNVELDNDAYPRIVVERGRVSAMGRGGLDNLLFVNQNTGEETKVELFSAPFTFRFYGTYRDVEQYASLVFMSLRFLTKPLKLFTIFKVGNPSIDQIRPYKVDTKHSLFATTVDVIVYKEGKTVIQENHWPILRSFAFKCSQVFDSNTGTKVIVRIS